MNFAAGKRSLKSVSQSLRLIKYSAILFMRLSIFGFSLLTFLPERDRFLMRGVDGF